MLATERQRKIAALIHRQGAVTVPQLVDLFQVSLETIRRDLLAMEKAGLLSRVYGGAVAAADMKPFVSLETRNKEHPSEKQEVARNAAALVCDGDYIAVDAGSTANAFAEELKTRFSHLTVVTYSLDVFQILSDVPGINVLLTGGHYLPHENAFHGPLALQMLRTLHVQKAFICPSAVSIAHGIGDFHQDMSLMQKEIMRITDALFVMADSSKFEAKALLKLDDMLPEYRYVTDSRLSQDVRKLYQENHIKIYVGGDSHA